MKLFKSFISILVATLLLGVATSNVLAAPIYSTFGPGDTYITGTGWTIGTDPWNFIQGPQFLPTSSNYLGSIEVAVGYLSGLNQFTIDLRNDNAGLPGSIIEAFSFTNAADFGSGNEMLFMDSILNSFLSSGTPYWLIASGGTDRHLAWNLNDLGLNGPLYQEGIGFGSGVINDIHPAFRLNPVPEPSTFILLGAGLAGFAVWRRKRS